MYIKLVRVKISTLLILAGIFWFSSVENVLSQHSAAEQAVLKVIEQLFEGMYQADSAAVADILHEEGTIISRRYSDSGEAQLAFTANTSFTNRIGSWKAGSVKERFWDANVMVDDGIAMVWTPYDLHVDGAFSHCGVDLFSLVNTADGWKVASITYNVKEEPCEIPDLGDE